MLYVAVRSSDEARKAVTIVAKERLEALVSILGPVEVVATVDGNFQTLPRFYFSLKSIQAQNLLVFNITPFFQPSVLVVNLSR